MTDTAEAKVRRYLFEDKITIGTGAYSYVTKEYVLASDYDALKTRFDALEIELAEERLRNMPGGTMTRAALIREPK